MATARTADWRNAGCDGTPKGKALRSEDRRNMLTVVEASGIPKGYCFTKYKKGDDLDSM